MSMHQQLGAICKINRAFAYLFQCNLGFSREYIVFGNAYCITTLRMARSVFGKVELILRTILIHISLAFKPTFMSASSML